MATLTSNELLAGAGGQALLPRSVSDEIWKEALDQAIVPSLAKTHPIILGDNIIPVLTKRPAASIVGELGNKPDSELEVGAKNMKPIKAVVGLEFSMETLLQNPANLLDLLSAEMSGALARQIDLAVFHGREASTGNQISGDIEYLAQTENAVELSAENTDASLWEGYGLVVGGERAHDFTGFAIDPRASYAIANARDDRGNRVNPTINMGAGVGSYSGQPIAASRTVSGQVDASADTGIRGFGGDWPTLRFGRALDINLKRIEYGDPFGNGDLQRRNAVAFLSEVIFGWAVLDTNGFVKYTEPAAAGGTSGGADA